VVVEVAGRLSDVVVENLDHAIQLALAKRSRGVVCLLSAVLEGAELVVVEVLATAGRHVRDWPGIPVAVACPDPQVRQALRAHLLGRRLIVTASLLSARAAVLATRTLTVERLRLAEHPTAPRAARDFVTHTLGLASEPGHSLGKPGGKRARGELEYQCRHRHRPVRRLEPWGAAPDRSRPRSRPAGSAVSSFGLHRRGLTIVAGLSRAFGVLPTADGGKVVWAVLEAPRPRPSTSNEVRTPRPERVMEASIAKAI
jgi:hypothetical protein